MKMKLFRNSFFMFIKGIEVGEEVGELSPAL